MAQGFVLALVLTLGCAAAPALAQSPLPPAPDAPAEAAPEATPPAEDAGTGASADRESPAEPDTAASTPPGAHDPAQAEAAPAAVSPGAARDEAPPIPPPAEAASPASAATPASPPGAAAVQAPSGAEALPPGAAVEAEPASGVTPQPSATPSATVTETTTDDAPAGTAAPAGAAATAVAVEADTATGAAAPSMATETTASGAETAAGTAAPAGAGTAAEAAQPLTPESAAVEVQTVTGTAVPVAEPEATAGAAAAAAAAENQPGAGTGAPAGAAEAQGAAESAPPADVSAATDAVDAGAGSAGSKGGFFSDIAWNGYFRNETAYRIKEPRSITKMRNTASLTGVYSFSPRYRLTGSGWLYYDMAYDIYDYDTIVARRERNSDEPLTFLFNLGKEKDSFGADLREFYLDMMYDSVDIRLGRQLVVWGLLEGVRIVDEINPIDFRELLMPDLLDSRIPLWMARFDWYRDEGTWHFLWIPDIRFHKPAAPGSEWELLQEVPGTIPPESSDLENSEFGARFSTNVWDTDLTFSYFYTWDDFPVIFRRILLNTLDTDMTFEPTYTRMNMYGSTASKQVGPVIVKGEFAYVTGKYFAVDNVDRNGDGALDFLGELERDHIRWGLGIEFSWSGMDIAPAVTQWIIPEYDIAMVQEQVDTSINLFIRKEMPRSSMLFELLLIDFVTLSELYINPEWTFFISDRFQIAAGVDLFSGDSSQFGVLSNPLGAPTVRDQRSQFVGNFHDNDRVYLEFTYTY